MSGNELIYSPGEVGEVLVMFCVAMFVISGEVTGASLAGWNASSSSSESAPSSSITVIVEVKWITSGIVLSLLWEVTEFLLMLCDAVDGRLVCEFAIDVLVTNRTISS